MTVAAATFLASVSFGEALPEDQKPATAQAPVIKTSRIPPEYGQVIYRFNEKSPNQIYIIGVSHRDPITLDNCDTTMKSQAETYKIGEWLVRNEGVELLLPEGFFKQEKEGFSGSLVSGSLVSRNVVPANYEAGVNTTAVKPLDFKSLEEKFSDRKEVRANAVILLKENYFLKIRQVEDKKLYLAAREKLDVLTSKDSSAGDIFMAKCEMDYLQQERTARLLQNIPGAVDYELARGAIRSRKALVTIGLGHIKDIIKYLAAGRIEVNAPLFAPAGYTDYSADLNLARADFGVTVIIPRSLAENSSALAITGLDKNMSQANGKN